ncbi:GNAT family N-acetyltransferase [Nonomuraea fuscirosea]
MVHISQARRGDGDAVEALAALALGDALNAGLGRSAFAAAIDKAGGQIPLPHGHGVVLIATTPDAAGADPGPGQVAGMLYMCPPIRFIDECADEGGMVQRGLTRALAEIELLAVAPHARMQGIGGALLSEAERMVRARGGRLLYVKVRDADRPVLRWYRQRGYRPLAWGETVDVVVARRRVGFAAGADGFRVAIKAL